MDPLIKKVHRIRTQLKLSIRNVAPQIGVSFGTLAALERGERRPDRHTRQLLVMWTTQAERELREKRGGGMVIWMIQLRQMLERLEAKIDKLTEDQSKALSGVQGLLPAGSAHHHESLPQVSVDLSGR